MSDYNFEKLKQILCILEELVGREEGRRENIDINESKIRILEVKNGKL